MGKGRRNRDRRTGPGSWMHGRGHDASGDVGGGLPDGLPFDVEARTVQMLGASGLGELAAQLWPVDCQTCGRGLAPTRPSLYVCDLGPLAFASLHHPGCQPPEWATSPQLSSGQHLSWTAQTFLLPAMAGERRDDRPVFLVNPSLEQVGRPGMAQGMNRGLLLYPTLL